MKINCTIVSTFPICKKHKNCRFLSTSMNLVGQEISVGWPLRIYPGMKFHEEHFLMKQNLPFLFSFLLFCVCVVKMDKICRFFFPLFYWCVCHSYDFLRRADIYFPSFISLLPIRTKALVVSRLIFHAKADTFLFH